MIAIWIVLILFLSILISIPFLIGYIIADDYAETLPEEEREKFWEDYIRSMNEHMNESNFI